MSERILWLLGGSLWFIQSSLIGGCCDHFVGLFSDRGSTDHYFLGAIIIGAATAGLGWIVFGRVAFIDQYIWIWITVSVLTGLYRRMR